MTTSNEAEAEPLANGERLAGVVAGLVAYEQTPGRFAVVLREPRRVFADLRLVLQLASGRTMPKSMPAAEEAGARQAARFFVRKALLRPGADHYTLLGLEPGFQPEALKDHYRMMIRLTHPDFARSEDAWPANAAARINIANTVLASPTEREAYTAQLLKDREGQASLAAPPVMAQPSKPAKAHGPRVTALSDAWATPKVKAWAMGLGVLVCLAGLMLNNPAVEDRTLKARSPATMAEESRPALKVTEFIGDSNSPAGAVPLAITAGNAGNGSSGQVPEKSLKNNSRPSAAPMDGPQAVLKTPVPVASAVPATGQPSPTMPARLKPSTELTIDDQKKTTDTATALKSPARALEPAGKIPDLAATAAALDSKKPDLAALVVPQTVAAAQSAPVAQTTPAAQVQPLALASPPASAPEAGSNVSAEDVRSVMQGLAKVLESGRGRNAYAYLAPETRDTDAAQQFIRNYQDALKGQKVLQINKTNWVSADDGEGLLVKGTYELVLEDYPGSSYVKKLTLQARIVERQGKTMLTRLTLLTGTEGAR